MISYPNYLNLLNKKYFVIEIFLVGILIKLIVKILKPSLYNNKSFLCDLYKIQILNDNRVLLWIR